MTIFDLLFLLAALASVVSLGVAAVFALRGRRARALKILGLDLSCALFYLLVGVAVAFLKPQRVIRTGDPWCFDDWCLTVEKVSRTPGQLDTSYRVELRIFSRAGRVAQRANGAWIYLIDDRGRRYSPDPDPSAVPLDVLLQPRESVNTSRLFHVPDDIHQLGLITGHGGPYCGPMAFLIIGESGCLFKKPTVIRIQ
jgi:hypothetical protein